jgi:hypothetical protein
MPERTDSHSRPDRPRMGGLTLPETDPVAIPGMAAITFRRDDGAQVSIDRTWATRAVYRDLIGAFYPLGLSPALLRFLADCDPLGMDETAAALILHARREVQL